MRVTPPGPVVEEVCAAEITHLWPEGKSLIPGAATMRADFLWNRGCYGARYGRRRAAQRGIPAGSASPEASGPNPPGSHLRRGRDRRRAASDSAARPDPPAPTGNSRWKQPLPLPRLRRRAPLLSLLSAGNLQPSALSPFDKPTVRKPAHNLKIRYDHGNFIVSGKHGTRKADPDPPLSSRRVENCPMLATLTVSSPLCLYCSPLIKERPVPDPHGGYVPVIAQYAQRTRIQQEVPPGSLGQSNPARCKHPQHVAVRE